MNKATKIIMPITLLLAVLISSPTLGQTNIEIKEEIIVENVDNIKEDMRKLWEDHKQALKTSDRSGSCFKENYLWGE